MSTSSGKRAPETPGQVPTPGAAGPAAVVAPTPGAAGPAAVVAERRSRRSRRRSRTRQLFLTTIQAQIAGTRLLGALVFAVLLGGALYWLLGTTGSPLIAAYLLALALVLGIAVYWFTRVMQMFTGKR